MQLTAYSFLTVAGPVTWSVLQFPTGMLYLVLSVDSSALRHCVIQVKISSSDLEGEISAFLFYMQYTSNEVI